MFTKQISPRAIIMENKINLYFAADSLHGVSKGLTNIYLSNSNDGFHWELVNQPVLRCFGKHAEKRVISPDIIKITEDRYLMMFSGFPNVTMFQKIKFGKKLNLGSLFCALSNDGITWDVVKEPLLQNKIGHHGFGTPNLVNMGNDKLKIFYHRRTNTSFDIWSADFILDDLHIKTQEKPIILQTYNLDIECAYSPYVLHDEEGWHMYYAGWGGNPVKGRILYAKSTDGIFWEKSKTPVLEPNNEYDSRHCSEPSLLLFNDKWHLYYEGCDSKGVWSILSAIEK